MIDKELFEPMNKGSEKLGVRIWFLMNKRHCLVWGILTQTIALSWHNLLIALLAI